MTAKKKEAAAKKTPAGSGEDGSGAAQEKSPAAATGHHVLIVDDSDSIRSMVRQSLEEIPGIKSIEEAADGLEGLSALSRSYFDLVITDLTMPRLDGFKLVSAIRQNPKLKDIMVIVLSSRDDSVDKIKGLTIGANDYVTKPFEQGELQARISVMLKMRDLQEELQRKNAAMEEANLKLALLANQDGLTGIPNRRYLFERLEVEFRRSKRLKSPLGLLMMDIDHFKAFNDTYGHLAGDEALRAVASVMQAGIRTYDMVGRYGGEEMIAYLPETDRENSLLVAERIRSAVAGCEILPAVKDRDKPVNLTISIGIACWPEIAARDLNELVDAADNALYHAKTDGRNRCSIASADDD